MERCKQRRHHRCKLHYLCLQLPIMVLICFWLADGELPIRGVRSDAANLLRGGNFSENPIQFNVYPSIYKLNASLPEAVKREISVLDVLAHGIKTQLPYWTCVHGGVQLWDATIYLPRPADNATFVLHMNSRVGGGHIMSVPMYTPRQDAEYVVSMSLACNPHGGPRNQSLLAIVFDAEGNEMQPRPTPIVVVSNPNSSMDNLNWDRRSFKMLGTSTCMYLYLVSMVKGYYGLLVANVQVNLATLLENGSFETLTLDTKEVFNNLTMDVTLVAPRPRSIPSWSVDAGKVKVSMTGAGKAFQSATDGGRYAVELNAASSSGEISALFAVPYNTTMAKNHEYVLLFDSAANPRQLGAQSTTVTASPYTLLGKLGVKVVGAQSNKVLLDEEYDMNSTGFTPSSVGWMTRNYSFLMEADRTAKVSFRSLVADMSFGPFVDNVAVYEVKNKAKWIEVQTAAAIIAQAANGNHAHQKLTIPVTERLAFLSMTTTAFLFLVSVP